MFHSLKRSHNLDDSHSQNFLVPNHYFDLSLWYSLNRAGRSLPTIFWALKNTVLCSTISNRIFFVCANYINNYHKSWIFLAFRPTLTTGGNFYSSLSLYNVCLTSSFSPPTSYCKWWDVQCHHLDNIIVCILFINEMQQLGSPLTWDHTSRLCTNDTLPNVYF